MTNLMTATKLVIAMQDSLLLLESSKTGWKTRESLKGTSPQCVAFDPTIQIAHIALRLVMDHGRQMMVGNLEKDWKRKKKQK